MIDSKLFLRASDYDTLLKGVNKFSNTKESID